MLPTISAELCSDFSMTPENVTIVIFEMLCFYMLLPSAAYSNLLHTLKHFSTLFFHEPFSYYFIMTVSVIAFIAAMTVIVDFAYHFDHVCIEIVPMPSSGELDYMPQGRGYVYRNIESKKGGRFRRNRPPWCSHDLHKIVMKNMHVNSRLSFAVNENKVCAILLDGKMIGRSMDERSPSGCLLSFFKLIKVLFVVSIPANTLTLAYIAYARPPHSISDALSYYYNLLTIDKIQYSPDSLAIYTIFAWAITLSGTLLYLVICNKKRKRLSCKIQKISEDAPVE